MSAILVYLGQTVIITVVGKKEPVQGIGVIISKEINKDILSYEVLGVDGKIYDNIRSGHLSTIFTPKKGSKPIMHGPGCTFKFEAGTLSKSYLKANQKKLIDHMRETWDQLNSGKLGCEAFSSPSVQNSQQAVTG